MNLWSSRERALQRVVSAAILCASTVLHLPTLTAAERALDPGLNLFSVPGAVPPPASTCFSLLEFLGGAGVAQRVTSVDADGEATSECFYDLGAPAGTDFPIEDGIGYFVRMTQPATVSIPSPSFCADLALNPGVNLIGVPGAEDMLGCFSLLATIGIGAAHSIERLEPQSKRFEACLFDAAQVPVGVDFPIDPGDAYVVHMNAGVPIINLNETDNLAKCSIPPPAITDFDPKQAPVGTLISVAGVNLAPRANSVPRITLNRRGGGTIDAPVTTFADTTLAFTIPTEADTGSLEVEVNTQSTTSADLLEIVASSDFDLQVAPTAVELIRGETISFAVTLTSDNGFPQLGALSVSGLPAGVTAEFAPAQIAADRTSILTLTAPSDLPLQTATLTVTADALVESIPVSASATADVTVVPVSTSFRGRAVIANAGQSPLAGVTITFLGQDGAGNATGCPPLTVTSDAAGNFWFRDLPPECAGPQLIRYDGLDAVGGEYAGVDLFYDLTLDAVTESPVLVHLPRIDQADTVCVEQNAAADQTFDFTSIPGLSITVYAGTTFTPPARMPAHSCPAGFFPIIAVDVPIDRLPEEMPPDTETFEPFIVAFQPANAMADQPVAITYPNRLNAAPSTNMALSTLDPTLGRMVIYGSGTVSASGLEVVPDLDPATPGRRFGIVNFDWHGPRQQREDDNDDNPCVTCPCPVAGNPVDVASGVKVFETTDLAIAGGRGGIALRRIVRTFSTQAGPFGIGTSHNYAYRLETNTPVGAELINLITPDGNRFVFSGAAGVLVNDTVPSMRGAIMVVAADGRVTLRMKDGVELAFIPSTFVLGSLLDSITDPNGNRTTLLRDVASPVRITQIVDPVGRRLTLEYDNGDRVTSITDPIGRQALYSYDAAGRLAAFTDAMNGMIEYVWDAAGRLEEVIDLRDNSTTHVFDATGRLESQTLPDGAQFTFTYETLNPLIPTSPVVESTTTDGNGHTTTYRFNPEGSLLNVTDPLGQTREYLRESGTNLLLEIRGNGVCSVCGLAQDGDTSFTYDADGNVTSTTDSLGNTTTYEYEPVFGKITRIVDAENDETTFTYDAAGNMLTRTDGNDNTTTMTYNEFGQLLDLEDPEGNRTKFTYDAFGNLVGTEDPLGNKTAHAYDSVSRLIATRDPAGNVTLRAYDDLDRLASVTDPRGFAAVFDYDAAGNTTRVTDARSNPVDFTYDELNRLETRTDSRGNAESRTYDFNGNLTQRIDRLNQTSIFAYDEINRLVTETHDDGAFVDRSYDANSRLIQAFDSVGGTTTFTWDPAGRLLGSLSPTGSIDYLRDNVGRVLERQVGGAAPVVYSYDDVGNLLSATTGAVNVTHTYDTRSLLESRTRSNGVVTSFEHDLAGRTTSITHTGPGGVLESIGYEYDARGLVIGKTTLTDAPLQTQPTVNTYAADSNFLEQWGPRTYSHDDNGNRILESGPSGSTAYVWDARNRLSELIRGPSSTRFTYDYAGNLLATQTTVAGTTLNPEQYVLDDLTNVTQIRDPNGGVTSVLTGNVIDEHLAVIDASGLGVTFASTDLVNSTVLQTDLSGTQTGSARYEPFGAAVSAGQGFPFRFTGRTPVEGSLYYYRARFYDPLTSRFASEDPIGFQGGDENLYRYVRNNPLLLTDPLGLTACKSQAQCISCFGADALKCFTPSPWTLLCAVCIPLIEAPPLFIACVAACGILTNARKAACFVAAKTNLEKCLLDAGNPF